MSNLPFFLELYKPLRTEKINGVTILETMEGKMALKENVSIDYQKLYHYLYSRGFSYVPRLIEQRENSVLLEYQEDINLDDSLKAKDLMRLVGLLHSKTSYHKEIALDTYKNIYETIKENIEYIDAYYTRYYDMFLLEEDIIPSHYLFLKNYSLLYRALLYCKENVSVWLSSVQNKNKKRVALLHNHLCLDHLLKNTDEYLISWDQYTMDSPILDLYHFYQNDWESLPFLELMEEYQSHFSLEEDELLLFCLLVSIPYKVEFTSREIDNCRNIERLFAYLMKSSELISLVNKE